MAIDPKVFKTPVFFCQGEALCEEVVAGEVYRLLEAIPACGLEIGDNIPKEWDLIPANEAARLVVMEDYDDDDFEDLLRSAGSRY